MIVTPVKKVNYLNNKDMLKEIHRSKNSYCEFVDEKYQDYDIIVTNTSDIFKLGNEIEETDSKGIITYSGDKSTINQAKVNRANRLAVQARDAAIAANPNKKIKMASFKIDPLSITTEELVFRVYTFEHIPVSPGRKKNPKSTADEHDKLPFLPFKHYRIDCDGSTLIEVGRSHSKHGEFCITHGSMTNKLAKMFILMVNKYGQRGNWRGYCVDEQTEALTQRGWLGINEINESDTIMSYENEELKWSTIKSIFRDHYIGNMHKITTETVDSLVTPGHKIVTRRGLIKAEHILESDKIILMGSAVKDKPDFVESFTDEYVELIGWMVTKGCYQFDKDKLMKAITIYQNEGVKADRIRTCLQKLNITFSEAKRKGKNICFYIFRKDSIKIHNMFNTKNLTMNFIMALSSRQRDILIHTMIDGDGCRTGNNKQYLRYTQKNKEHIDLFQALCAMSGKRSNTHLTNAISFGKPTSHYVMNIFTSKKNTTNGECLDFHGGKRNGRDHVGQGKENHPNVPTTPYNGMVWCPETEFGSFLARRNGTIYLTGNSYLEEMKGQALLQLAQMGLRFDEFKSDNPFSYYTASISNSFTRVFNIEKRNQELRDDLLMAAGSNPSFSRQNAIDEEIRKLREDAQSSADIYNE